MPAINASTDGSVLALDGSIRVGLLPSNPPSRVLPEFNLTIVAAAPAQSESIQVVANKPLNLYDGQPLLLSNGQQITTAQNKNAPVLDGVSVAVAIAQDAIVGATSLWLSATQPIALTADTILDFAGYKIVLNAATSIGVNAAPVTVPALLVPLSAGTEAIVGGGMATVGPTTTTITATAAAAANATSITLSSSAPRFYPAGTVFNFGGNLSKITQDTTITATAAPVAVEALPNAIALNATATAGYTVFVQPLQSAAPANTTTKTKNLVEILGIEQMDQQGKSTLVSTRSMKSGLGNSQRVAMNDTTLPVQGYFHVQSLAYKLVILPVFRNSLEVYAEIYNPVGERLSAPAIVANLSQTIKLGDVVKYTFDLNIQDLPKYVSV